MRLVIILFIHGFLIHFSIISYQSVVISCDKNSCFNRKMPTFLKWEICIILCDCIVGFNGAYQSPLKRSIYSTITEAPSCANPNNYISIMFDSWTWFEHCWKTKAVFLVTHYCGAVHLMHKLLQYCTIPIPTWDILPLILYMIINIPLVPLMVNVRELSWLSVLNKWSCDTLFPATISLWGRMEKYKKFSTWMCIVIRKMTGPVIVIFRTDFWNDNGTPLLLCHCYGMEKWGILYQISVQLWKPVVVNSLPNCVLSFPCKLAIKMMEYNLYVMS